MEESGLCGIEWAIRKRIACVEECKLCGSVCAVWKSVGFVE